MECVELLLDASNATVNSETNDGTTPLHYAAYFGFAEIVRMLLDQVPLLLSRRSFVYENSLYLFQVGLVHRSLGQRWRFCFGNGSNESANFHLRSTMLWFTLNV